MQKIAHKVHKTTGARSHSKGTFFPWTWTSLLIKHNLYQ